MDCEKSTYHKCGEIFLANEKQYTFLCFYCDELCYEFNKFKAHIKSHINAPESVHYNILSDFPIESLSGIVNSELEKDFTYNDDDCLQIKANELSVGLTQDLSKDITVDTITNEELINTTIVPIHNNIDHDMPTKTKPKFSNSEVNVDNQTDKTVGCLELNESTIQLINNFENNAEEVTSNYSNKISNHTKNTKANTSTNIYCLHCKQLFKSDSHDFKKCTEMKKAKAIKKFIPKNVEQNKVEKKKLDKEKDSDGEEYSDAFFENILPARKLEMPYQCCYCDKLFRERYQLDKHIRIHTNYRPFKCKLCPSAFTTDPTLQKHIVCMHTKERPFACGYEGCNRKFKLKGPLKQHEKQHLPDALAFQCEICGKQYKTRTPLVEHKYLHTGEKPFKCSKCPKTFRSNKTLWCHKKVHSDVRQYSCKFCSKAFKQLSCLYMHLRKYCQLAKASKSNSVENIE